MNDFVIRQENESEYGAVENLVPELNLVIEKAGEIIGQIMYVRTGIEISGGGKIPVMTFGPISIAKKFQRQGYGAKLLAESMARAAKLGVGALAITGSLDFYGRFGFVAGKSKNIFYAADSAAEYFLVKELAPNFCRRKFSDWG